MLRVFKAFSLLCFAILLSAAPFAVTALPIKNNDLYRNAETSYFRISPEGAYYSFLAWNNGKRYIYIHSTADLSLVDQIEMDTNDIAFDDYYWIDEHKIIVDVRIEKKKVLFYADFSSGSMRLFKTPSQGFLVSSLPNHSAKVLFAKYEGDEDELFHLYEMTHEQLMNGNFDDAKQISYSSDAPVFFEFDPVNQRIFAYAFDSDKKTIDLSSKLLTDRKWNFLTSIPLEKDNDFTPIALADQNTLIVLSNAETDKVVVQYFDLATQTFGDILFQHDKYDIASAGVTRSGELAYVNYYENGLLSIETFGNRKSGLTDKHKDAYKDLRVGVVDTDDTKKSRILALGNSTTPLRFFLHNIERDTLQELRDPYPKLRKYSFSPTETFKAKTQDGLEIEGYLNRPLSDDKHTLIVMPHGGPVGVRDYDRFNRDVQYFTSRGFSVLRVNFRGSSGFGKKFINAGKAQFGKTIEQDISLMVDKVSANYDFAHYCAMGASYGGYSSAMLAIKHPQKYECVISHFGVFDLPLIFNQSNADTLESVRKGKAEIIGDYSNKESFISPVKLHAQFNAPILLIAGKKDDIASKEHSNRFKYVLQRTGKPVEYIEFSNAYHGFSLWQDHSKGAAMTLDFIMRTLGFSYPKPETLSDDEKAAIAADFVALADAYMFDDGVANDEVKADKFVLLASEYGHARSTFNYGIEQLGIDVDKALAYIHKSNDQGYAAALDRIGWFYEEGTYVEKDEAKAMEYYEKSFDKYQYWRSGVKIIQKVCDTSAETFALARCIDTLDRIKLNANPNDHTTSIITTAYAELISTQQLTEQQRQTLKAAYNRQFGIVNYDVNFASKNLELRNDSWMFRKKTAEEPYFEEDISAFRTMGHFYYVLKDTPSYKLALVSRFSHQPREGQPSTVAYKVITTSLTKGKITNQLKPFLGRNVFKLELLDFDQNVLASYEIVLNFSQ